MWRMGGGLFDDVEYLGEEKTLQRELSLLLIPKVDAAKETGRLLTDMPRSRA